MAAQFDLDDIIQLENQFYEHGKSRGNMDGATSGRNEGFHFGVAKGRQMGEEVGQIKGYVTMLKNAHEKSEHVFNDRIVKMFDSILLLIDQLPIDSINSSSNQKHDEQQEQQRQDDSDEDEDDDLIYEGEDGDAGEFMTAIDNLRNKFKLLEVRLHMDQKKRRPNHSSHSSLSSSSKVDSMSF